MKRGTCGPDNLGRIICSASKPTMLMGFAPCSRRGIFINKGGSSAARDTRQNAAVAASGSSSSRRKPATTSPGCKPLAAIRSTPRQEAKAEHGRQPCCAHLCSGACRIIGHAHVGQGGALLIEDGVGRGGNAVAGLSHRAQDCEPAPLWRERNGGPGDGGERGNLSRAAEMVDLRNMDVSAEGSALLRCVEAAARRAGVGTALPAFRG